LVRGVGGYESCRSVRRRLVLRRSEILISDKMTKCFNMGARIGVFDGKGRETYADAALACTAAPLKFIESLGD
jgi:hypothetical protein